MIWLSEIILQQTRVAQGLPYFNAFIASYDTVEKLSAAPIDDVLRLWQGLGYYSRARNMHKCANKIVKDYNGKFPSTSKELQRLPGIGPYTAAAIASIAFGENVPVLDGNVYRVLSRLFDLESDISSPSSRKVFLEKAQALMPTSQPGQFNQAMMEFGALYCTPQKPDCKNCILSDLCLAHIHNTVHLRPVKLKKTPVKNRYFNYLIFEYGNRVLVKRREEHDIWQGLYEFFMIEGQMEESLVLDKLSDLLESSLANQLTLNEVSSVYKHLLTHQRLFITFYKLSTLYYVNFELIAAKLGLFETDYDNFEKVGKPIIINKFLNSTI